MLEAVFSIIGVRERKAFKLGQLKARRDLIKHKPFEPPALETACDNESLALSVALQHGYIVQYFAKKSNTV